MDVTAWSGAANTVEGRSSIGAGSISTVGCSSNGEGGPGVLSAAAGRSINGVRSVVAVRSAIAGRRRSTRPMWACRGDP